MNVVTLTGRLTKEWDVRVTQNGSQIARNSIAVQRKLKDQNGEYQTDFINVIAFGKTADVLGQYTYKGNLIGIQGRIQTGSYENQNGQRVYTTDVIVETFDFLESNKNKQQKSTQQEKQDDFDLFNVSDEDLPF